MAVWKLIADAETDFGRAILGILKKQFPGQEMPATAKEIGRKMMLIAQHQLQKNPSDAMDSIQDFLVYLTTGSKYEMDDEGNVVYDEDPETGEKSKRERTTAKPWDFAKDFDTPAAALKAIYTNLKRRSIDKSKTKTRREKAEKTIDEAFGSRGEDGGAAEGGEGKMPTPDTTSLSQALDDKASTKQFIELIDKHVDDLRDSMPFEQQMLFDLVFKEDVGTFGSDIKENMGQATAFKDMLTGPEATDEMKELYEKNAKRWSGFVGNTRTKLLESIRDYIDNELPASDVNVLWDEFFSDISPEAVARKEQEGIKEKEQYQLDIDKRKAGRLKWKTDNGEELSAKEQKEWDRLKAKLEKSDVNIDDVEALSPDAKGKKLKKTGSTSLLSVALKMSEAV